MKIGKDEEYILEGKKGPGAKFTGDVRS